jgi:hypothetical protein
VTIVTTHYRPKRAPRKKRKQPPIANRIVTPAPLKPLKGPVIRLGAENTALPGEVAESSKLEQPKRLAIVEPKRKRSSVFGDAPNPTPEDLKQAGDKADALWRELVRRATGR